jgi:L-fucose isomerase-like protein
LSLDLVTAKWTIEELVLERLGSEVPKLVKRCQDRMTSSTALSDNLVDVLGCSGHQDILAEFSDPFRDTKVLVVTRRLVGS